MNETVKVTYKQNWPAYNAAQTEEKERFIVLLDVLCKLVDQPPQAKGRPRLPLADMLFACVYKVYSCFSSRRFMTDLRTLFISPLHYAAIFSMDSSWKGLCRSLKLCSYKGCINIRAYRSSSRAFAMV